MSTQTKSKRGGKRPGAGRPAGSKNVLGYGEVKAIKAAGLRVPESATPEQRELADEALETTAKVMRGEVSYLEAPVRLKAATQLRTEICGPVPQKQEVTGANGEALSVQIIRRVVK